MKTKLKQSLRRLLVPAVALSVSACSVAEPTEFFELDQVRLLDSPFAHAQQTNVGYLLQLNQDKLLAPYLRDAGLPTKADNYGNWENSGLDGHIGGHYLSALSLAWAATGDQRLKDLLDDSIAQLRQAQLKNGNGYIGGVPNGQQMWQQIHDGEIDASSFGLNNRWVPLYNIHKIYAGLRDAYQLGENETAKQMLLELGEWTKWLVEDLSDEQIQHMLVSEHGGMNEVMVDIAEMSGDDSYLQLAKRFSHQTILQPLLEKKDALTGLHANTQIPKVIGFLRVAEHNNPEWEAAADFFWQTVTEHRSVSIGGNSVREHFHDANDFSSMVDDAEGPETCNTYNMQRLSKLLFSQKAETKYLAFYERAMYNHILSSQHPEHGGLVYFTSMRPGHYRMYSSVHSSMWCCVGSGIENHSKYGELIYAHQGDELLVNLFVPSTLDWQEEDLAVSLQTDFPDQEAVTLDITKADGSERTISIRQPIWLENQALTVRVNGEAVKADSDREGYVSVTRTWNSGDTLSFNLEAEPRLEGLPDGQDYYSVMYGPVVLASKVRPFENENINFVSDDSRMGHIASGATCPPEALPVMVGDKQSFLQGLKRVPGPYLSYQATQGVENASAQASQLIPFFRLHDSRYQVYWPQMSEEAYPKFMALAEEKEKAQQEARARTIDQVNPGEQQPEVEHDYRGEQSTSGVNGTRHWRDSRAWFSYQLSDPKAEAKTLRLTYFGGDKGREFEIWFNGHKVADVTLSDQHGVDFYTVDYKISGQWLDAKDGKYEVKFVAKPGSIAGGLYGLKLLR